MAALMQFIKLECLSKDEKQKLKKYLASQKKALRKEIAGLKAPKAKAKKTKKSKKAKK